MAKKDRAMASQAPTRSAAASKDQGKPLRRVQTRSANFVSIYTNDIQLMTSSWDLRMVLGEIGDSPDGETAAVGITQLGEVRMSPQLAKRLTVILVEQLKTYEERFGVIPLPKA